MQSCPRNSRAPRKHSHLLAAGEDLRRHSGLACAQRQCCNLAYNSREAFLPSIRATEGGLAGAGPTIFLVLRDQETPLPTVERSKRTQPGIRVPGNTRGSEPMCEDRQRQQQLRRQGQLAEDPPPE